MIYTEIIVNFANNVNCHKFRITDNLSACEKISLLFDIFRIE